MSRVTTVDRNLYIVVLKSHIFKEGETDPKDSDLASLCTVNKTEGTQDSNPNALPLPPRNFP